MRVTAIREQNSEMDGLEHLALTLRVTELRAGIFAVAAAGECDLHEAPRLEAALASASAAGAREVLLDLAALEFLDSTGLQVLLRAQDALAREGAELVLVAPSESVLRLLQTVGLESRFPTRGRLEPAPGAQPVNGDGQGDGRSRSEIFRSVNERILEISADWGDDEIQLFCECPQHGCLRSMTLSRTSFERLRTLEGSALVSADHAADGCWTVLDAAPGYLVVSSGAPLGAAAQTE